MLAVSYQQVRCHKNENMSTNICVCVDRDGVQMVLPVSSQQTRLQFCGCLKTELKLLSGNWRVPTSLVMNIFLDKPIPRSFAANWLLTCFRNKR